MICRYLMLSHWYLFTSMDPVASVEWASPLSETGYDMVAQSQLAGSDANNKE